MSALCASVLLLLLCACQRSAGPAAATSGPKKVRAATVAGQFYPGDAKDLEAAVQALFVAAPKVAAGVKAVLVPHAGYVYSGAVAAASFRQLAPGFARAVIVAGNHTSGLDYRGAAVDRATHYAVPGIEVEVAPAAAQLLSRAGFLEAPEAPGLGPFPPARGRRYLRRAALRIHWPSSRRRRAQCQDSFQ